MGHASRRGEFIEHKAPMDLDFHLVDRGHIRLMELGPMVHLLEIQRDLRQEDHHRRMERGHLHRGQSLHQMVVEWGRQKRPTATKGMLPQMEIERILLEVQLAQKDMENRRNALIATVLTNRLRVKIVMAHTKYAKSI